MFLIHLFMPISAPQNSLSENKKIKNNKTSNKKVKICNIYNSWIKKSL